MRLASLLCSLSFAALTVCGPLAYSQATVLENEPAVLYVDAHSGSDSNSGSASAPLKTIQAAVNKANSNNQKSIGTKIIVNAGVYRETVKIDPVTGQTSAPLTVQAATNGTAIISASDVLSGWSPDEQVSGAYVTNWTPTQSTCALPNGWPSIQEIALHTEMVFVNGVPMTQVLAESDLKPGTFFVSTSDGTLHVFPPSGVDPSTATIEAASRAKTISVVGRSNIVLRGMVFQHAASCINTSGATVTTSNNVLIDSIQANWNNFGGLAISSSTNVTVQNSIADYNGGVGFQGTKDQTTLYTGNETDYNNWRGAQAAFYNWAMGGTKLFQMRSTTIQNHISYNNQAQGLWFDTDNKNITIDNVTLSGSYNAALQLERNEGPITLQNSRLCSSGVGVNVLTTEGLTVKNNIFYGNGATNKYEAQFYLAGSAGGINITDWQTGQVYDLFTTGTVLSGNTFIDSVSGQFVFGTYLSGSDWTDFTGSLKSGNNTWFDPNTSNAFHIVNGKNVDLAGWQTATGADYNSTWTEPASLSIAACTPPPASYPDFSVTLDNGAYPMTSGRASATVRVTSFNFGAVNLSVSGLPAGVTASFSNPSLVSGVSVLSLTASSISAAQTVPVTLWAISGDRVHDATFNLAVTPNPGVISTTTSLSASSPSITQGNSVTLTATVQAASGSTAPSGSVAFYNGGTSLGSATLSGGVATFSTADLPVGPDTVTASYAGTSGFTASSSNAVQVTVNTAAASTTTSLSASPTNVTQNSPVTLTATVSANASTTIPTGTVTFYNGSTALGSASLSGGVATLTTSSLPVGSDELNAAYSGATGFNSSTSNAVSIAVNPAVVSTTTTLTSSSASVTQGFSVTLTATVAQSSGTATPTGNVSFYNGSSLIGSSPLAAGVATLSTSSLPIGANSISAAYSGAVTFKASSSGIVVIAVNAPAPTRVNTTTALSASATSIVQNTPVTFVANVSAGSGTATPSGTVNFLNGSTVIGSSTLVSGAASFTTSALSVGSTTISARYAGASGFNASGSNAVSVIVNSPVIATSTRINASPTSIIQGAPVVLTATVAPASGTNVPTGSVTFSLGSTTLGTATLAGGSATLTTSGLPLGTDAVTATYAGTSSFSGSLSSTVSITVAAATIDTTTVLGASATSVTAGSAVTITATVKQASGTSIPTGSVVFYNGAVSLGTATLTSGKASLSTSSLPVGTNSITADYAGTAGFNRSSAAVMISVEAAAVATTTSLTASSASAASESPITFHTEVKASSGTAIPSGTVTFLNGTAQIGTASLVNGVASFMTTVLPEGRQAITAAYGGNSAFLKSASRPVDVTITPKSQAQLVSTRTAITSSAMEADQGFTICLTATVASSSGSATPEGDVEFSIGERKIGSATLSGGKAYLLTSSLPSGKDAINAQYSGNSTFAPSTSAAITVRISGPDFTITAKPGRVSTALGNSADVALLITPMNGFKESLQLSCSDLPEGATCSFTSPVKQADGTSVVSMEIHTASLRSDSRGSRTSRVPFTLAFLPLLLVLSSKRRKAFRRFASVSLLAVAMLIVGSSVIGCGGMSNSSTKSSATVQTVSVTVTAHANTGISHSAEIQLTLM